MNVTLYFNCEDCNMPVDKDNLQGSYMFKKCKNCKHKYFYSLVEKRIETADRQTLDFLLLFFKDSKNAGNYGWSSEECEHFTKTIIKRGEEVLKLSTILMQGL